jgi:hypothetical protein
VFWGPLAYVLIGGVGVGTVLTLLFLPALYSLWFKVRKPTASALTCKLSNSGIRANLINTWAQRLCWPPCWPAARWRPPTGASLPMQTQWPEQLATAHAEAADDIPAASLPWQSSMTRRCASSSPWPWITIATCGWPH